MRRAAMLDSISHRPDGANDQEDYSIIASLDWQSAVKFHISVLNSYQILYLSVPLIA